MSELKIIAIYLPQFYQTEYNDQWWGSGYTEWTACKKAVPLFKGHRQPRIPLNNNYYDLSKKENIRYQAKLAKEYGIDGFAIYHYYSCGKTLLEKPVELIYENRDIEMPYYFYWANHDWRKNWFGQDKKLLWAQEYGDENEWEAHYQYCRKYFSDERYIKIDNKPVFFIFKDWEFIKIDKFIALWNELAKKDGYAGIYFVKTLGARGHSKLEPFDAVFERNPFFEMAKGENIVERSMRVVLSRVKEYWNKYNIEKQLAWTRSYPKVCKKISEMKPSKGKNTILGVFTGWDNTPRKQYNGSVFLEESAEEFEKCLLNQIKKAEKYGCPQIVINAWNEWAEGSYLEPDSENGYAFLEAVRNAKMQAGDW